MTIWLPSHVRPSYATGYARSRSESASPELWPNHAWVSGLGSQSTSTLRDVAGIEDGTLTSITAADVSVDKGVPSISYDGVSDYAILTTLDYYGINRKTSTVVLWMKTTDTSAQWLYGERTDAGGLNANRIHGRTNSGGTGRLEFTSYDDSQTEFKVSNATDTGITDGEWHVVAVTFDGSASDIFVDGVSMNASVTGSNGSVGALSGELYLGAFNDRGSPLSPFAGEIALFALYTHVLSVREIRTLHRDPLAPFRRRIYLPLAEAAAAPPGTTGVKNPFMGPFSLPLQGSL